MIKVLNQNHEVVPVIGIRMRENKSWGLVKPYYAYFFLIYFVFIT